MTEFRLLWDDELESLPPREWLVEGLVPARSLVVLVAPRESGKTVSLVGMALSIGAGLPFFGRAVKRGVVVYIYAEGSPGLPPRVEAFKASSRLTGRSDVLFLPRMVQLLVQQQVLDFTSSIEAALLPGQEVAAIVVDTISRCTPAGDENSKADQSLVVWAADHWRERFGCSVILVGHPTKARGKGLKGSEEIENSADAVIRLEREGQAVTFYSEKDRDGEHFQPFTLEITPYADSVILTELDPIDRPGRLTPLQLQCLQCLADISESLGCSNSRWERAATQGNAMSIRTFWSARKRLLTEGYVMEVHGGKCYAVAPKGQEILELQCTANATAVAVKPPTATPTPSLRRGGIAGLAAGTEVHGHGRQPAVLEPVI